MAYDERPYERNHNAKSDRHRERRHAFERAD